MIFLISAILNCEISGETNAGNHDAKSDAVGCHGYRRSGHMQYTRPPTADWPGRIGILVSSLLNMLNNLVNVIFMSTCVSIKLDSVAHFLVCQIFNYVRLCAPQM